MYISFIFFKIRSWHNNIDENSVKYKSGLSWEPMIVYIKFNN
jgi:hypothetical protein